MKSIVLYFYPNKPGRRNSISDSAIQVGDKIVGYVRCELHKEKDGVRALDAANPRANETVLNSVEL